MNIPYGAALALFNTHLPKEAFFGRGPDTGPRIIMTDDIVADMHFSPVARFLVMALEC